MLCYPTAVISQSATETQQNQSPVDLPRNIQPQDRQEAGACCGLLNPATAVSPGSCGKVRPAYHPPSCPACSVHITPSLRLPFKSIKTVTPKCTRQAGGCEKQFFWEKNLKWKRQQDFLSFWRNFNSKLMHNELGDWAQQLSSEGIWMLLGARKWERHLYNFTTHYW